MKDLLTVQRKAPMPGSILFLILEEALRFTDNPNFFPSLLLIGAFIVPAAFITYFYDHVRHREISLPLLTTCFIVVADHQVGAWNGQSDRSGEFAADRIAHGNR